MKTIGIIGGMGPLATVDLFQKIVIHTMATKDQDHIPIVIDNNTRIADRTLAIVKEGPSPVPELIKSGQRLEKAGADMILMGCNTVHYFYQDLAQSLTVPLLHMPKITAKKISQQGWKKVGILGSTGAIFGHVYQDVLEEQGISWVLPKDEEQKIVQKLIYDGVKKGCFPEDAFGFKEVLTSLCDQGAEVFIMGCTELPVAMEKYNLPYRWVDPTLELAKAGVEMAGGMWVEGGEHGVLGTL